MKHCCHCLCCLFRCSVVFVFVEAMICSQQVRSNKEHIQEQQDRHPGTQTDISTYRVVTKDERTSSARELILWERSCLAVA